MFNCVGLIGEVFDIGGQVAIATPPCGVLGAIRFEVIDFHTAQPDHPAWADLYAGSTCCRINPEICEPPYFRLADCLAFAHSHRKELPRNDVSRKGNVAMISLPPAPHPNSQKFVFWREFIDGMDVVMIDTLERFNQFSLRSPVTLDRFQKRKQSKLHKKRRAFARKQKRQ